MEKQVWSKNYQKSRENFNMTLKSLESKGINISHSELNINELDPYGNNLYVDVAWIGNPEAEKLYMSTSGIHGVEGFAGSAIQLSVLNSFNKIPDNVAFAFIHILNPWGMSWIRRENESNVDLNRNFRRPCDKNFSSTTCLRKHEATCELHKKIVSGKFCKHCDKMFSSRDSFKRHYKKHHPVVF